MTVLDNAKVLAKALIRRRTVIAFDDMKAAQPISRSFGTERGRPIDRYYIEQFLSRHRHLIVGVGLEVAEIKYLTAFGVGLTSRQILVPEATIAKGGPEVDGVIVADLTQPGTVPVSVADCFVCTQTLNVIYDVRSAVASARKLLKPGGTFLGTVAAISQVSRYDADRWGDYWRFMPQGIDRLLRESFGENVSLHVYGNELAARALLRGISCEDLPSPSLLDVSDADYPVIIGFLARN